jgi:hypothetical protein
MTRSSAYEDRALEGFAELVRTKLRANAHKGEWSDVEPRWLLARLREEVRELEVALDELPQALDARAVQLECADVVGELPQPCAQADERWAARAKLLEARAKLALGIMRGEMDQELRAREIVQALADSRRLPSCVETPHGGPT